MSRFRVYIKPFDDNGDYVSEFIEVTDDVEMGSIGNISQKLDADEFDLGVFTFDNISFKLRNDHGRYSDVDFPDSIFSFKRSESLIKITWSFENEVVHCGTAVCGLSYLAEEITLFTGLLNDKSTNQDINSQYLGFVALGQESILDKVEFPFTSISNGDAVSDILFTALNQTVITNLLTVDALNINPGLDVLIDDKAEWENATNKEVIDDILFMSNSVMYIKDNTVFIKARVETATSQHVFNGYGALLANENIQNIKKERTGKNKVFNFLTWKGTSLVQKDVASIAKNDLSKKAVEFPQITDTTKRNTILSTILAEFKNPKREMLIFTPLDYGNITIFLLDKVNIDYPAVQFAFPDEDLPIFDQSYFDEAIFPIGENSLEIDVDEEFKIMSRKIDIKKELLIFEVRKV